MRDEVVVMMTLVQSRCRGEFAKRARRWSDLTRLPQPMVCSVDGMRAKRLSKWMRGGENRGNGNQTFGLVAPVDIDGDIKNLVAEVDVGRFERVR